MTTCCSPGFLFHLHHLHAKALRLLHAAFAVDACDIVMAMSYGVQVAAGNLETGVGRLGIGRQEEQLDEQTRRFREQVGSGLGCTTQGLCLTPTPTPSLCRTY